MIYKLQKKFIIISAAVLLTVVAFVFSSILVLNASSMNRNMDMLADRISDGGGKFPDSSMEDSDAEKIPPRNDFINPETPFSTRHFTVFFDENGKTEKVNIESVYSIDEDTAVEYAENALEDGSERGWIFNYRYKVFPTDSGKGVVFVDGSMNRSIFVQSTTIAGVVLLACVVLVLVCIFLFSKRATKPIAESYEKQKQFITDANHELKTPLTLILANVDIAEVELGKSEWLDDIRAEGHRMADLVGQLVELSRMDESRHSINLTEVSVGELIFDMVQEFQPLAKSQGKTLVVSGDREICCLADEMLLHRLVTILIDNSVKYCDNGGEIRVVFGKGRRFTLTVENTYSEVGEIELNRLFDRFYRADKARKFTGGYGIGLSMAKAIVEKHSGEICAYKKDCSHIGFKVVL